MSDFILSSPEPFQDKTILELGCGIGMTGIALHGIAHDVYLTDHNRAALQLCHENIQQNTANPDLFRIRMLDWTCVDAIFSQGGSKDTESPAFRWMDEDGEVLKSVDIFLAADVIYDPPLTTAFFQALARLMRCSRKDSICYLSLEKRFNFTLEDLDVRDPAYDHFRSFVDPLDGGALWSEFLGEKLPLESIPQVKTTDSRKVEQSFCASSGFGHPEKQRYGALEDLPAKRRACFDVTSARMKNQADRNR